MKITHLHKLRTPVPPTAIPAADLDQVRRTILEQLARLPLCASILSPEQRSRRAAPLGLETRTIVLAAVEGLREAPQLFADVPLGGADLAAAQDEADAALRLSACLSAFAQLAYDHYLSTQADAAAVARGLCRLALNSPRSSAILRAQERWKWPVPPGLELAAGPGAPRIAARRPRGGAAVHGGPGGARGPRPARDPARAGHRALTFKPGGPGAAAPGLLALSRP